MKLLSRVWLSATPWTVAHQAPPSMGFSRWEYWSGLPFPSPGDLPDAGIEPRSPTLQADALTSEPPIKRGINWKVLGEGCKRYEMLQIPEKPRDLGDWKRSHHHRYSFSQLWALGLLHRAGAVFILSCQEEEKVPLAQLIFKILGALLALNFVPLPGTGRGSLKAVYHRHVGSSQKEEGCCGQRQPCTPARGVLRWKRSEEEECLPRVCLW